METTTHHQDSRSIDVTGLPEEVIRSIESLVSSIRARCWGGAEEKPCLGGTTSFRSREEWVKAIRDWANGHTRVPGEADWGRESIYAGRGE